MRKLTCSLLVAAVAFAWGCFVPDVNLAGKACGDAGAGVSRPCAQGYVCQGAAADPLNVGTCVPNGGDAGAFDAGP